MLYIYCREKVVVVALNKVLKLTRKLNCVALSCLNSAIFICKKDRSLSRGTGSLPFYSNVKNG